ncbi:hypothetical protein Asp14428_80250 [Actinoplanes sp. NBRC 14428]|nr:hypothetical protein Asp14428_80250 [Actinoplanes sp. NBRC 14428]
MFRTDRSGEGLRDLHGASRSVAYLALAAAPYLFFTGILTPRITTSGIVAVLVTALVVAVAGVVCLRRPESLPRSFWLFVPAITTVVITALNLATNDASTGAQFFYLWPILYAANFLRRRAIYLNLALVSVGDAAVVLTLLGPARGTADLVATVLAMSMTAVVVSSLRGRADRLRRVLERQANADALTGLANRRSFTEALTREGARVAASGGSLALVTVDLDHFKSINDTYGHTEGDRALQAVASAMRTVTGDTGVAARLGGDEFVMLLRTGRRTAVTVAESLTRAVAGITDLPGGAPSLSIGVAVLPGDAGTVDDLITASDAALYHAKTSGRGRISVAGERLDRVPDVRSFVPHPRP